MVRKSSRAAALKASEKTKRGSPRNHRRRSNSGSENSDEEALKTKNPSTNRSEKGSSGNESDTESKKPLKKRSRSMAVNAIEKDDYDNRSQSTLYTKNVQQDNEEEVNQENMSKGKSKSINSSNYDNVDPETENENVQVTDESPNDAKDDNPPFDDELSKNGMESSEIDVNISQSLVAEMTCDNQSSEIFEQTTEIASEVVISEHAQYMDSNIDDNSSDLTQANLETAVDPQIPEGHHDEEEFPHKHANTGIDHSSRRPSHESRSSERIKDLDNENPSEHPTKESTGLDSTKKIKLNRLPRDRKASVDMQADKEDKKEEREAKRKITLKRPESKPSFHDEAKPQHEGNHDLSPKEHVEGNEWGSVYESTSGDNKLEKASGEKSTRKRITLKRPTIDDVSGSDKKESASLGRSTSLQEKSERRKSSSGYDNIVIVERKRRSSAGAGKSSESEEKPQKIKEPSKVVKLIRNLPEKPQEPPPPGEESVKKHKWGKLEALYKHIETLNLEKLQEVSTDIEFLDEGDVDLELEIRTSRSPEKVKRKTFKELEEEEMENIEAELNAEPEEVEIKENIIAMNRKISIVDDTASKLKPPPSPARHPTSEVLFITNLVRPFTVKQLKELLERTGKIREDGFWTDRIKSKCYVYYETTEEAESTRNALHGVHWPIGNGKKLVIDYATVEDLENAKNPPIVVPKKEKLPEKENKKPEIKDEKHDRGDLKTAKREWNVGKEDSRSRRSLSRSRERRERKHSRRSYTPEDHHHNKKRKQEEPVPQKAMDDLFLKTKATPSIYWQPLSPEEIARKQQLRQARLEENKRRLQEIRSSGRGGVRDRSGRDRTFRRR